MSEKPLCGDPPPEGVFSRPTNVTVAKCKRSGYLLLTFALRGPCAIDPFPVVLPPAIIAFLAGIPALVRS